GDLHVDDAPTPAHSADHQLQHSRSGDPSRRGAECGARCAHAACAFQFVRLRRAECFAGDRPGTRMTNSPGERRSVLVTGGGRGLGAAIVRVLAEAGHDVTFTYRSAVDGASALVADLTRARPQQTFSARQVDLADT